jgi:hypothetical protein
MARHKPRVSETSWQQPSYGPHRGPGWPRPRRPSAVWTLRNLLALTPLEMPGIPVPSPMRLQPLEAERLPSTPMSALAAPLRSMFVLSSSAKALWKMRPADAAEFLAIVLPVRASLPPPAVNKWHSGHRASGPGSLR